LNEYELAKQRLEAAIEIRERIEHPEVGESKELLKEVNRKLVPFRR